MLRNQSQDNLKVLHICKVFRPENGGVQRVVEIITTAMKRFQHTVLTTGEDGAIADELDGSLRIVRARSYMQIASMPIAPKLGKSLRRLGRNHDLIAVHYPFPLVDFSLLTAWRMPPIIVHWHSRIVAQKKLKWLVAPFSLLLFWRANAIVVTSPIMISQSRALRLFKNKVRIIAYGLPAVDWVNHTECLSDRFLLVGRHVSYKGFDIAIKALSLLEPHITLRIVGSGPLLERHRQLAKSLNVEQRISFITQATDEEVLKEIAECRALVVPSIMENEAFAMVQLEAMRLAKPIINTQLPSSVPWVARHNKEAITIEPSAPHQLARAMEYLISRPETARKLGENGFTRFNSEFSEKLFVDRLTDLYLEVANSK